MRLGFLLLAAAIIIAVGIPASTAQSDGSTNENHEDCVADYLRKNPNLKDRFDNGLLKEACRKSVIWQNAAINGAGRAATNPLLTPSQTAWADQVFKCFDLRCMCRMFDICKNMLGQIESSLGNVTDHLKEGAEKIPVLGGLLGKIPVSSSRTRRRAAVSQVEELLAQRVGKATRKEIRRLSDDERRRFFRAMQTLKTQRIDTLSKYDIMIVQHTAEYSPGAHFGAAFLPFHREFMKNLEIALRTVDPSTALPYWDSTLDQGLPDPRDSIIWSEEFMGNGQGDVTTGPFANWTTVPDSQFRDLSPRRKIVRNLGLSPYGSLFKEQDIAMMLTKNKFRDLVYCVDPFLELAHGANHLWIGGHMNELRISPNDPIFFLLHSFVDYMWEEWRQNKQQYLQRLRDYTTDAESCNQYSYAQIRMRPYTLFNVDGLSNQYVEVLYNFESRPTCSGARPDCGSQYLFCHKGRSKCLSKIRIGGNCNGLDGLDACHRGQCVGGRCVARQATVPPPPPPPKVTQRPAPIPGIQRTTTRAPSGGAGGGGVTPTIVITSKDTVWLPITVLSLNGRVGTAYPKAQIITTEASTGTKWNGVVADPSQRPYYTGAAYAQARSPHGQSAPVRGLVNVYDESGRKCSAMCREEGVAYNPCQPALMLALDPQLADGTPFSQNVSLAKYLNWQGTVRTPDRLLFLCPVGKSVAAPAANPPAASTDPPTEKPTVPDNKLPAGPIRPQSMPSFSISTKDTNDKEENIVIRVVHSNNNTGTPSPSIVGGGGGDGLTNAIAAAASAAVAPPRPPGDSDCRNDHRCCVVWAKVGECQRNEWMLSACKQACKVCNGASSDKCIDRDSQCASWSSQGKCKSNDVWMEENCKASCNVCSRIPDELEAICGASKSKDCANRNGGCTTWAKEWECVKNPWWMKENCPESCNYCKKN